MINRPWLNRFRMPKKRLKRGAAAIADLIAVIGLFFAFVFVLRLSAADFKQKTPLFDKIRAGSLKEGDHGQLSLAETLSMTAKISAAKKDKK